jgi:methionyl-tRNA synthetase
MLGEEGNLFGEQIIMTYEEPSRSHVALTYDGSQAVGSWTRELVPAGRQLPKPSPLFRRLEPSVAEEELARLGQAG